MMYGEGIGAGLIQSREIHHAACFAGYGIRQSDVGLCSPDRVAVGIEDTGRYGFVEHDGSRLLLHGSIAHLIQANRRCGRLLTCREQDAGGGDDKIFVIGHRCINFSTGTGTPGTP